MHVLHAFCSPQMQYCTILYQRVGIGMNQNGFHAFDVKEKWYDVFHGDACLPETALETLPEDGFVAWQCVCVCVLCVSQLL